LPADNIHLGKQKENCGTPTGKVQLGGGKHLVKKRKEKEKN